MCSQHKEKKKKKPSVLEGLHNFLAAKMIRERKETNTFMTKALPCKLWPEKLEPTTSKREEILVRVAQRAHTRAHTQCQWESCEWDQWTDAAIMLSAIVLISLQGHQSSQTTIGHQDFRNVERLYAQNYNHTGLKTETIPPSSVDWIVIIKVYMQSLDWLNSEISPCPSSHESWEKRGTWRNLLSSQIQEAISDFTVC